MRTEAEEQALLIDWTNHVHGPYPQIDLLFHIPNEGKRNLTRQGLKKGVPDLFLPVGNHGYLGLFIEMKREKGGTISPEQKQWIERLRKEGYRAEVCRGFEEAKKVIEEYLKGEEK